MLTEAIIYYIWPSSSIPDSYNTTPHQRLMQLGKAFNVYLLTYLDSKIPDSIEEVVTLRRCPMKKSVFSAIFFYLWCIKHILSYRKFGKIALVQVFYNFTSLFTGISASLLSLKRIRCIADIWDDPDKPLQLLRNMKKSRPSCFVYWFYFIKGTIKEILVRLLLPGTDLVICALVKGALDQYGMNSEKVFYTTNGVDLKRTNAQKFIQKERDSFKLLYLGPIMEARLIEDMCNAVHTLRSQIKGITLTMAGPMYFNWTKKWFNRIVEQYFGNGDILYLGNIPHEQALSLIADSDICLCPLDNQRHYDYTYPIKIFEYQVMGKPVIASSLTGVREIIRHKENGYLIEPGNPNDMIEAVQYLYENQHKRETIVENAKKELTKYDWDLIHQDIIYRIFQLVN